MKYYQIYFVDGDQHLRLGEKFYCADDTQAMVHLASAGVNRTGAELWEGGRPVAQANGRGEVNYGLPKT